MAVLVEIPIFFINSSLLLLCIQIGIGITTYSMLSLAVKIEPAIHMIGIIEKIIKGKKVIK